MTYHYKYRRLWIEAGYRPDMGSACAVKPPPEDYLAAYHFFTEAEHALDAITQCRIKVTRISTDTNDPFEFEGFDTNNEALRREIRKWKDEFDKNFGLLCFSKDWTSPALWAHYSNRHRGICLGFWARCGTFREVVYDSERTDVTYKDGPTDLSSRMKEYLVRVKAYDWHYEQEIRRCVQLSGTIESDGKRYFPFEDTLRLSEVILGARCCTLTVDDVRSIVRNPDIAVFQARSAHGFFKMVPDEDSIPP